jgi:hypothetical protein
MWPELLQLQCPPAYVLPGTQAAVCHAPAPAAVPAHSQLQAGHDHSGGAKSQMAATEQLAMPNRHELYLQHMQPPHVVTACVLLPCICLLTLF